MKTGTFCQAVAAGLLLWCGVAAAQTVAPHRFDLTVAAEPRVGLPGRGVPDRLALTGWTQHGNGPALGLSLGLSPHGGVGLNPGALWAKQPSMDLGVRWRTSLNASWRVDLAAWRRLSAASEAQASPGDGLQPRYGTSVELQFHSVPGLGFSPEPRAIGLRLEGGGRLSLRHSGPVLYYRAQF